MHSQQRYKSTAPIHLLRVLYLPLCSWYCLFWLFLARSYTHVRKLVNLLSLSLLRSCRCIVIYLFNFMQTVCSSKLCACACVCAPDVFVSTGFVCLYSLYCTQQIRQLTISKSNKYTFVCVFCIWFYMRFFTHSYQKYLFWLFKTKWQLNFWRVIHIHCTIQLNTAQQTPTKEEDEEKKTFQFHRRCDDGEFMYVCVSVVSVRFDAPFTRIETNVFLFLFYYLNTKRKEKKIKFFSSKNSIFQTCLH